LSINRLTPTEAELRSIDIDCTRVEKAGLSKEHVHAKVPESCSRVVGADLGTQFPHALHKGSEVHSHTIGDFNSEFTSAAYRRGNASGADDPLGRNATHVQAVAAHQTAFNERDFGTKSGGDSSRYQSGRAGTDHNQIIIP
jgi:hypothetical protein